MTDTSDENLFQSISSYYSEKVQTYGATPRGVDWKDEDSQILRFNELLRLITKQVFSIIELGCGYGKLVDVLQHQFEGFSYLGYDLAQEMIQIAQAHYATENRAVFQWITGQETLPVADYVVASGIFNVKMNYADADWQKYILDTLHKMDQASTHGFSFNLLTSYSDREFMREDLYYGSPQYFFDYCMRHFSRRVQLRHDYPLYEFTMLVKKTES